MMNNNTYYILLMFVLMTACSKKSPDTPIITVPEKFEISPANKSISTGETTTFTAKFYNNLGEEAPLPSNVTWSSSNASIATISQTGLATALSPGQVEIKIQHAAINATALLTVVANATQVATVSIPALIEVSLNGTQQVTAVAKNINDVVLTGKTFSWQINNSSIATIESTNALITGKTYGTTTITATSEGIVSNPATVQVIRVGTFMGMGSVGMGKLKLDGSILSIETSGDFSVQTGPPDLRLYLSNNSGNVTDAIEIATLTKRNGVQNWIVPGSVSITKYKYIVVWCKQFGGAYGVAELPG